MKTIVLANRKGGVGKTTLSGHLGVAATEAGAGPVALIDVDPQGNLAEWWNERKAPEPHFAAVEVTKLAGYLAELDRAGIKLAIIDTPPQASMVIAQVVAVCDLVIIPSRPSPHDLRAVGATVEIVEAAKKKMLFVINGASARANITGEAAIALSQHGTVANVTCFHRTNFASSMIDGRTVLEIDSKGKSADEIRRLWTYVAKQLRNV